MKKLTWLLLIAMLLSLLASCGASNETGNNGGVSGNTPDENKPANELHAAFLKTNALSSFDGTLQVEGTAEGQTVKEEIAVSAGYTEDEKFAANLCYEDNSGMYFVGNERYTYSGQRMGGPCRYLQCTHLQYDILSSVLSYVLIPVGEPGALQLSYPNSLLIYSIEDIAYTSKALMALSPKTTEENGEASLEFSGAYADLVKALIPNTESYEEVADIQYTLTIRVAKEGYISYIGISQSMADDATTPILTRTFTIDAVNTNKKMEQPRQLTLPSVTYDDYRFSDGKFLYVASPENLVGKGKHPSELEKFHVDVWLQPFTSQSEPVSLLCFPTELLGKPITKIYTDLTIEKLIVPKELNGKWEGGSSQTEVFAMWEKVGAGSISGNYKNVYYLGEWDLVDGVPMV